MLVKMSVDPRGDARCIWCGLVGTCNVDLENPREANLELDRTVLVEIVIPHVFCWQSEATRNPKVADRTVVCKSADHTNYQPTTADGIRTSTGTIICVLPQQTCVLFMDAYGIIDDLCRAIVSGICARLQPVIRKHG